MAGLAQTPRTAARAPEKKKDPALRKAAPAASQPPAYLQRKMALSQPGDQQEQQADHVAQQVARALKDPQAGTGSSLQRASLEPGLKPQTQPLARKAVPAAQAVQAQLPTVGPAARKAAPPPKDEPPKVARMAAPGASAESLATPATAAPGKEPRVARAAEAQASDPEPSAPVSPAPEGEVDAGTQAQIEARKGGGEPLPAAQRAQLEAPFEHSFAGVRIHRDPEANRLATQLQARAFTVGSDIYFASGAYAPDSDTGRELLAHELTHVVQQRGAPQVSRAVDPAPSPAPTGGPAATALAALSVLDLPPIKHRHAALYAGTGSRRAAGYARNTSEEQVAVWNKGIELDEATIEKKLSERTPPIPRPTSPTGLVNFKVGSKRMSESWRSLRSRLLIPEWDRRGKPLIGRDERFQVDHMVELQVFGDTNGDAGNKIGNLELLKGSVNGSSGAAIKGALYAKVADWLTASDPKFAAAAAKRKQDLQRSWLKEHAITFTELRRVEGRAGNDSDWWTRAEINAGTPLEAAQPEPKTHLEGNAGTFVLASGAGGMEIARYPHKGLNFEPASQVLGKAMAGIRIQRFELNDASETGNPGDNIGSLKGVWELPDKFRAGESVTVPLVAVGPYCGSPGKLPALNTDFSHLSPVSFPEVGLRDGHLYAEGELRPSLPLLANHPIRVVLDGEDIRFEITYTTGMIALPFPGLTVESTSLALFYSGSGGFGGGGAVEFGVQGLGSGELEAAVTQTEGFSAQGMFHFDSRLFDQADVRVWYRQGAFGGEGTLGINGPDKVRGIRSAHLAVGFAGSTFNATGEVQPNLPGVQQAGLTVSYAEAEGLLIGGNLQLAPNPAIRSGAVEVTLRKRDDVWTVGATGTATPAIPGVDSQLTVSYDEGAFLAEFRGAFRRGMLDGSVQVGATNRTLSQDGQPSGPATPDSPLIVYGSGSAALRLTPWLQATAGLQFSPNGEVTVAGRIGLPSAIELFARRQLRKPIFNVAVQIPIIPGIVAEVGGNLSATAGFGPGTLEQLDLGITYNPAHEADTTVTGDARFVIPADAGLRLAARAGIGLGITGASATGGLELGGQLGIAGRAEASAHVVWSPSAGLDLTAQAALSAQPKFKFDVSGYVSVSALGFSVYDNSWQLAAYELGSNLTFGVAFPIHYQEGKPLDISLDDVTFQVPDVDPGAVIRELADTLF